MGKALVWLGKKIILLNNKLKCGWNKLMVKLTFSLEGCQACDLCKCDK